MGLLVQGLGQGNLSMMAHGFLSLLISVFILSVTARPSKNEERESLRELLKSQQRLRVIHQQQPDVKELGHKLNSLNERDEVPASCTAEYAALPQSTMCNYPDNEGATNVGVSDEDKQTILDEHNGYRSAVSPTATNMFKAYWDDNIAKVAQKYAHFCPEVSDGHDSNGERAVPGYGISIGQNLAWGTKTWAGAIKNWHSEVSAFTYGSTNDLYKVGHYTQVVNSNAMAIGCGYAYCPTRYKHTYVCNYSFGQSNINEPYNDGDSCKDCPGHCTDKLCDCGKKLCLNGGTLNPATCKCECKSPYTGSTCQQIDCPAKDTKYICTIWDDSYCKRYSNVPRDCPWLCGTCTQEGLIDLISPADPADDAADETTNDTNDDETEDTTNETTNDTADDTADDSDEETTTPTPTTTTPTPTTTTEQLVCKAGKMISEDGSKCVKCSAGTSNSVAGETCKECDIGFYQPKKGKKNCKQCPGGGTTNQKGSTEKDQCILVCKAGKMISEDGSKCVKCSAGTSNSVAGETCKECDIGFYQPKEGKKNCKKCPDGKTTNQKGSSNKNQCIEEKQDDDCPDFDMEYSCSVWPESYCKIYSNVEPTCPILCGICPATCPGISGYELKNYCKNGGTFDTPSCSCKCADGFLGDTCTIYETGTCPRAKDHSMCIGFPTERITCDNSNLGIYCPYLCKLCVP